jgi:hypothetical protein
VEDLGDVAIIEDWMNDIADDVSKCVAQDYSVSAQHQLYS